MTQPSWWHLALRLKLVHRLSDDEIAETLGKSRSAVLYATNGKYRQSKKREVERRRRKRVATSRESS